MCTLCPPIIRYMKQYSVSYTITLPIVLRMGYGSSVVYLHPHVHVLYKSKGFTTVSILLGLVYRAYVHMQLGTMGLLVKKTRDMNVYRCSTTSEMR